MQDSLCAGDSADAPTLTGPLQNEESEESMPTLTDEIKAFIVRGLARFDSPSEVAEAVMFGSVGLGLAIDAARRFR